MLMYARKAWLTFWFHYAVGDHTVENVSRDGLEYQRSEPLRKRFPGPEGSGKTIIALALVSLLALPVCSLFPRHASFAVAPRNARMQSKELKQRAYSICTALGAVNPKISEPQFVVQTFRIQALPGERRMWTVACQAGSHSYDIMFNDVTGNMESMYADGLTASSRAIARTAILTSADEAVEGSVRRLRDLQLVPEGTRIALAERPTCDRDRSIWRVIWKVRRPDSVEPYEVRMVLNGGDATPMIVVNRKELERSGQN